MSSSALPEAAPMLADAAGTVAPEYSLIDSLAAPQRAFAKSAYFHKSQVYLAVGNRWVGFSASTLASYLLHAGFTECPKTAKALAREVALSAMLERPLAYVGELAGLPQGVHETAHGRVLVPVGFRLPVGREGTWGAIACYLRSLLGEHQMKVFMANLKVAREILRTGSRRTITVQFFVGPPGCGKSVALRLIISALGGRGANAFRFLSGATDFNADLAGVEVLLIDDNLPKDAHRACARMVARIKEVLGASAHRLEGKGRSAVAASLTQFPVGAINDNPDAIRVIPRLTEDFADKITLYSGGTGVLPPTRATGGSLLCETLTAELPAFLHAVDTMEIPADLRDERYGVKAYHAKAVLDRMAEADSAKILFGLLDLLPPEDGGEVFKGRAAELHGKLLENEVTKRAYGEFVRIYLGNSAPIQRLGELLGGSTSPTGRIRSAPMRSGHNCWIVYADGRAPTPAVDQVGRIGNPTTAKPNSSPPQV